MLLVIAASIHIYRGATGQLQANGRSRRSQMFYVGLGIALFSFLLMLFHTPLAIFAILIGLAIAIAGSMKPASAAVGSVDVSAVGNGVER